MKLLLDSHILLWILDGSPELKPDIRRRINDPKNQALISAASVWEIEIKRRLGKLEAPSDWIQTVLASDFAPLSINFTHAAAAGRLPRHHDDPFDRMLIAQAQTENLAVVTRDRVFAAYSIQIVNA